MKSYDYKTRKGIKKISWIEFHKMCSDLAERIAQENFDIVIGIAKAGLLPAVLVATMIRKEFFPIRITRRRNDYVKWKKPVWKVDVPNEVSKVKVLIVDEIADTGETLSLVSKRIKEKGAKDIKTAALVTHSWAKPKPDYFNLESDKLIIFPWNTKILVNEKWELHPEIKKAINLQKYKVSRSRKK
ncbi:MAG: hypothetical protein COV00_03555 [Candidatus Tagabacteria bacterium CG10_big_fil_rev_8_21_14_0_10_40_13]|uniref:Phosphoribosyltransferase domain-containing protein n=1 Tax=Candidatus Tagabacteria bacterium CG10_big_fil_rev_8_21_14_0_10_40_13 TaxID=1975022 RepID=A0A2M8L809_9BACT|nr:MAG: hypothetical protein COV00_03555 [Candidatus Tagabacteria bacterium CG10_big_fil_rev_8_21_14_0_10_40_13]